MSKTRRWRLLPCSVALILVVGALVSTAALADDWRHVHHDTLGSGHSAGAGRITSAVEELPAVSWQVPLPATDFGGALFGDIDGDGTPEVLQPFQQGVAAFDLVTGALRWATPGLGITLLIDLADLDGDGVGDEIVAVSSLMGGGVHVIDLADGGVLWSFSTLAAGSGVHSSEIRIADLDGDGADELVFAAFLNRTSELYYADLSTPDGVPAVAVGLLQGTYNLTTRFVVGDFDGDGTDGEIVLVEGLDLDLFARCDAGDSGAVCDDGGGSTCLCHVDLIEGVFDAWAFPAPPYAIDVDGDGDDELVSVHVHPNFLDGFGVYDPSQSFVGLAQDAEAVTSWAYQYESGPPQGTRPVATSAPPTDLDGDGVVEVVVTILDAGTAETGGDGNPIDDGVDDPGAFTVAVYSGADGGLLASLPGRYAFGTADLDGDGAPEVIVQTTDGRTFSGGHAEGLQLTCGESDCALTSAWSSTGHRLIRAPEAFDDVGFPPTSFDLVDPDDDDVPGLLVWSGSDLVSAVVNADGGLDSLGSVSLSDDDSLAGVEQMGSAIIVNRDGVVTSYDGVLTALGASYQPPSQAAAIWYAAVMGPGETRATPILNGSVFNSVQEPTELGQADVELRPNVALIADVDGDDLADIFSWESLSGGALIVARHEFDGAGGFALVWEWDATDEGFVSLEPRDRWSFATADFDDDGVEDLFLVNTLGIRDDLLVLDGATGVMDWSVTTTSWESTWTPIWLSDLIGDEGYGSTDGVPDIFRPTRRRLTAWQVGESAPEFEELTTDFNSHYLFADIDDDGTPELVGAKALAITEPYLEAWEIVPAVAPLWGPQYDVDLPANVEQTLAAADVDEVAGMDVTVVSSSGALSAYSGSTGARLVGFPLYLGGGAAYDEEQPVREPLSANITVDLDGDGNDEALVGSRSGWLYAVDIAAAEGPPGVQWAFFVGAPVTNLGAADIDGDGEVEILLGTADGVARVLDGLGVSIEIVMPAPDDCISGETTTVAGTSVNVETVDIEVSGSPAASDVAVAGDGSWAAEVEIPLSEGVIEIMVWGNVSGVPAAADQLLLAGTVDMDGDGVTICEGDCDDFLAEVSPDLDEVCDDELDNDCDGDIDAADSDCEEIPDDDDATDPPADDDDVGDDDDDTVGDCNSCDGCVVSGRRGGASLLLILAPTALAWRSRRRRTR